MKIGVTLVQVDAVVTDDNGNPVRDLTADEFEVFEDGHKQRISNFSFINTGSSSAQPRDFVAKRIDKTAPDIPAPELAADQVRRTIAFVVDDLSMSGQSTVSARLALRKFVSEQMRPGDLVAIIRTGVGIGALQQFTSDKRRLYAAIDRIWWNPLGTGGLSSVQQFGVSTGESKGIAPPTSLMSSEYSGDERRLADEFRQQVFAVGTLGALNYVIKGLTDLPGRKSVVLMSDGFPIFYEHAHDTSLYDPLHQLADLANRASVVVYTIDTRGLVNTALSAADKVASLSPRAFEQMLNARTDAIVQSQQSLLYLAAETGGLAVRNSNDIGRGLDRIMNEQTGYYLIGFVPDEKTFKTVNGARPFHDVKVTVKRAGLHVRYHHGFYGITDEEARAIPRTRAQQLGAALISPFSSGGVGVKLTALFSNSRKSGTFVRSLVHIDAGDLTFSDDPDGWRKAVMDVVVMAFGDNGRPQTAANKTFTIRARADEYREMLERGLVYNINLPLKKEGAYQIRVAVRDANSKRLGSANQFLNIPKVKSGRLELSGIVLTGMGSLRPATAISAETAKEHRPVPVTGAARQSTGEAAEGKNTSSNDSPAVRIFSPGERLDLAFIIFNAKQDKSTHKPDLRLQLRLFKNGELVSEGPATVFDAGESSDPSRIGAGGTLALKSDTVPGQYAVQVVCSDMLASEKHRTAQTWIDFEVK